MDTTTLPVPAYTWATEDLDLGAYLARIGRPHDSPSAESLAALHEAHVRTIPFENVDPLLGRSPSLELGDIVDKLVHRRRGGYCFEHNLLLSAALEQLGYEVVRQTARVRPANAEGSRTHMNLRVRIDGVDYLADVGFGAGIMYPMPLLGGSEVDQAGWRYRLTEDGGVWNLDAVNEGEWRTEYTFDLAPQRPVDYEVANHYTGTHPRSPFTQRLITMRLSDGVSRQLLGDTLVTRYPDGSRESVTVMPDELADTLRSMGIELTADELARVRARYSPTE